MNTRKRRQRLGFTSYPASLDSLCLCGWRDGNQTLMEGFLQVSEIVAQRVLLPGPAIQVWFKKRRSLPVCSAKIENAGTAGRSGVGSDFDHGPTSRGDDEASLSGERGAGSGEAGAGAPGGRRGGGRGGGESATRAEGGAWAAPGLPAPAELHLRGASFKFCR